MLNLHQKRNLFYINEFHSVFLLLLTNYINFTAFINYEKISAFHNISI